MAIHIIFAVLYVVLSNVFSSEAICLLFMAHCGLAITLDIVHKKPLHLLTVYYIGMIVVTLANYLLIDTLHTTGLKETNMYRYLVPEYVGDATLLWTIGNTCIFIGYSFFQDRSFASIALNLTPDSAKQAFYVIIVLVVLRITGNAGFLSFLSGGFLILLSSMSVIGILFYARLWVRENNVQYRNYAIILCIAQTWISLTTSYLRFDLVTPFLSLVGGYFLGKGSFKYVFSYRVIPLLLFAIFFSSMFQRLAGNRSSFISAFTQSAQVENESYSYEGEEDESKGAAFERAANVAQLTNLIRLTEQNGFYGGSASAPLLWAFIPRAVWPDKPQVQLGAWYAVEIGVAFYDDQGHANNSINMTIPGHLYLDFGWVGLVVGCLFFGWLIASLWNAAHFNESPYNLSGAVWGGYLLLYAFGGMGADLQIVVSLLSTYLSFLIIVRVLRPALLKAQPRKALARVMGRTSTGPMRRM